MMMVTPGLRTELLMTTFRQVWVSLHTGVPGAMGSAELTGGGYRRAPASFNAEGENTQTLEFAALMPAGSGSITHMGIWTDATAVRFLVGGAVAMAVPIIPGMTYEMLPGDLVLGL